MRNGMLSAYWLVVLALGFVVCGCQSTDENPNWDPSTNFPDWTYDKPMYVEPAVEPKPYETVANGIEVYYTQSKTFYVRHPNGKQGDTRPRTAVWYSYDGGNTWQKNGFYGLYQSFYTFVAEHDGQYWIRFVGPGLGAAEVPPGQPNEIHVVDTLAPQIEIRVEPPPIEEYCIDCNGNEIPCDAAENGKCCCHKKAQREHIYYVGEKVNVYWTVSDMNLEPQTIELSTCFARFPHNLVWSRFKGKLDSSGSIEVTIPSEAATQAGMRFRMVAHDKAKNIGLGLSEIMEVQLKPVEVAEVTTFVEETPPGPDTIQKAPPKRKPAPLGVPAPPPDLTEPVQIETPPTKAPQPTPKSEPKKITPPKPVAAPKVPAAKAPVKKPVPAPVVKKAPAAAKKPERTKTSLAIMEREMEQAEKAKPAPVAKPTPKKAPEPIKIAAPRPTPVAPKPIKKTPKKAPEPVKIAAPRPTPVAPKPIKKTPKKTPEPIKIAAPRPTPVAPKPIKKTPKKAPEPVVAEKAPAKSAPVAPKKVPVKVLAKAPAKESAAWTPAPPASKPRPATLDIKPVAPTEPIAQAAPQREPSSSAPRRPAPPTPRKPTTMKLSEIPEKVQQGWPAKGMTLHGGVSRLLNWLPDAVANYKMVELRFSSTGGKKWITVASGLQLGRVVTWTVPMVTSKNCLLRVVGLDGKGARAVLETSEAFRVDAGTWETIDMSGFKMEIPKAK